MFTDLGIAKAQPSQPIVLVYGKSVEQRPLIAYTYGNGSTRILIIATIHGNERNTRPLAERLIRLLDSDPSLYSNDTLTVIPCVNPDGWTHSTRTNAHGVDLNRNFPVGWHPNVAGKFKRGNKPLSERETAALADLVTKLRPQIIVSIHNPLHLLDYTGSQSLPLATLIASYDHYPVPKAGVGYPTPGSFGNYAAKKFGAAIVTLELPNVSVDKAWDENRAALLAVLKMKAN